MKITHREILFPLMQFDLTLLYNIGHKDYETLHDILCCMHGSTLGASNVLESPCVLCIKLKIFGSKCFQNWWNCFWWYIQQKAQSKTKHHGHHALTQPFLTVSFRQGWSATSFWQIELYSSEVGYWVWFHTSYAIAPIISDLTLEVTSWRVIDCSVEHENRGSVNVVAQFQPLHGRDGARPAACPDT